jgi:phosphopantothenoylcysteine decarboxylase/phosphopantothenate--cysteine ligase
MRDAVREAIADADVLVMAAAVADYRAGEPSPQKIKKGSPAENADGSLTLRLVRTSDILGELAAEDVGHGLLRVGFAAETNDLAEHARAKLVGKRLDLLVANDVSSEGSGFGSPTNAVTLYYASGQVEPLALQPKSEVAVALWDRLAAMLAAR